MSVADPLSKTHPELAAQWHPTRNEGLTPEDVRANSYKKVWWVCGKGHEWDSRVNRRALTNTVARFVPAKGLPLKTRLPRAFPRSQQNGTRP